MPHRASVAIDAVAVGVGLPCKWLIVNLENVPKINIMTVRIVKWLDM